MSDIVTGQGRLIYIFNIYLFQKSFPPPPLNKVDDLSLACLLIMTFAKLTGIEIL